MQRALSRVADHRESLLLYGHCLIAHGRRGEAREVALRLASAPLERADWNDSLGTLLTYCDDPMSALPFHERAVALAAEETGYRYNLATAQRMTGDLAGAEASLDRVVAAAPGDVQAHYTRADLRTQTPDRNHIDALLRLLSAAPGHPREEIMLCFAVAKELEDVARYDESFAYLARGCDLQRRSMIYDVADDIATLERIAHIHDCSAVAKRAGNDRDGAADPIFVMGLPRSGTTLVEQILGGHSAVHAAGELQAFPAQTMQAVQHRTGRATGKLEFVQRAWELDSHALGRAYLDATRTLTGTLRTFVDKQPLNYLYAGLIARALPQARLVAVARDPLDGCYAMYKTLFTNAYPFSYHLEELGRYYGAWHRLLRHWRATLGERLLIVQYEELVADPEGQSRRLLAHCRLPWEDSCLAFHERRGGVTTASAAQVRRPVYATAVGKWRPVERQLAPLANALKPHEPPGGWRLNTTRDPAEPLRQFP
ncbi:MAG: sulfotransferase family protein [Gammaproteobacteria bacterium]|nr:sulfotransferase family protein [Gammaproteobacteria bacterium]